MEYEWEYYANYSTIILLVTSMLLLYQLLTGHYFSVVIQKAHKYTFPKLGLPTKH